VGDAQFHRRRDHLDTPHRQPADDWRRLGRLRADTERLYLGLGDPFDIINIGGSMVKSIDGGTTWSSPIDLGNALSVRDILVDTSGPDDILVVATDDGLYRSIDSGRVVREDPGRRGGTVPGPGDLEPGAYQRRSPRRGAALPPSLRPTSARPPAAFTSRSIRGDLDADPEWRRCLFRRRPRDAWRRRLRRRDVLRLREVTAANDQQISTRRPTAD